MPTTTATISLTNDIASVPTSITASFDLLKAGSTEGMVVQLITLYTYLTLRLYQQIISQ